MERQVPVIVVHRLMWPRSDCRADVMEVLREAIHESHSADGIVVHEAAADLIEPGRVLVIEVYDSPGDYRYYSETGHIAAMLRRLVPLVDGIDNVVLDVASYWTESN
ncbi:MAG: hypothetical protein JJLCMIEE_03075 [Acidimicrobiales bacterium]|nr:MAG: hypothetical protein EDR02_07995 [Actinomycetota bacterium]MBV6509957.1 hypothetical protein [Acidimicrobiales bacterium]RIK08555.1 MAG: hypothetical protein DCC48_01010 [Acidobacteriota bacterium]